MRFDGGAVTSDEAARISTASSLLPFFGTRLRRQNLNLAPTQYRQLRRLAGIKQMCSSGIRFGRSIYITPIMYQLHVKIRTRTNCNSLFSSQRFSGGFYTGFVQHPVAIQSDCDSCQTVQCRYPQDRLFHKNIYRLE